MAGVAGRSGRKSKAEEMELKALLDGCVTPDERAQLFTELKKMARGRGRHKLDAIKLLLAYLYGTPRQAVEVSGDADRPLRIEIVYADGAGDAAQAAPGPDADQAGA